MNLKRAGRGLLWALGLSCLLVIGLVLAWLASNNRWVDAAPQPRPSALQLRPTTAPPEANVFFDLAGLLAPANEAPLARGQAVWAGGEALALHAVLASPKDPLWNCNWTREDCLARWSQEAVALAAVLREQELLLGRCAAIADALGAGRRVFEEPMAQARSELRKVLDQYAALPRANHVQGANVCLRGFQLQAAQAQLAGDSTLLAQSLGRGQVLTQAQISGAQSLIAQSVAWSQSRQQLQLLAALLAREPGRAGLLAPLLGPLPARAADAASWMPAEAYVQAQVGRELVQLCGRVQLPDEAQPVILLAEASAWERLKCNFGFMPQRTQQANDAWWLQQHEAAKDGPEALLRRMQAQPAPDFSLWSMPFRNTIGAILLSVAHPAFDDYPAKQADLLLDHRVAQLALALATQHVPVAERGAWLARQDLTPSQRERITLSEDGLSLRVLPWAKPVTPSPGGLSRSWPLAPL
ncbi:hypothetical protein [Roseateles sp.]|uniref:hypothetical protein n=1 Tax=Roseateles sp. TaxID=1971397 RepID=UPI003D0F9EF4